MAKIGLQNFLYGILTEASDGTASYGAGTKPGKAVSCNVSISNNDAKLYADDGLAEADTSFQSGTVTIEVDNADLTTQATLLGHTVSGDEILHRSESADQSGETAVSPIRKEDTELDEEGSRSPEPDSELERFGQRQNQITIMGCRLFSERPSAECESWQR